MSPTPTSPSSDRGSTSPIAQVAQPSGGSFAAATGAVLQASPRTPRRAPTVDRAHTSNNLTAELDELMGSSSGDEADSAELDGDGLVDFFAAADATNTAPHDEAVQGRAAYGPEPVSESERLDSKLEPEPQKHEPAVEPAHELEPESGPQPEYEHEREDKHGHTHQDGLDHAFEPEPEPEPQPQPQPEPQPQPQPQTEPLSPPLPQQPEPELKPKLESSRPTMATRNVAIEPAGKTDGHGDDEFVFCCCGKRKQQQKGRARGDVRYQRVQMDEGDE